MKGKAALNGIVLAGGKSSRMGSNKALIEILGVPMMIRQIVKLKELFEDLENAEILVSVREIGELDLPSGARYVEDLRAGEGPLMGLYSGLQELNDGHAVLLGVDMPRMDPPTLSLILEDCEPGVGVVPCYANADFYEPLAAVYPIEIAALAGEFLDKGQRSMQEFVRSGIENGFLKKWEIPKLDAIKFMNMNCPEDLTEFGD